MSNLSAVFAAIQRALGVEVRLQVAAAWAGVALQCSYARLINLRCMKAHTWNL